MEERRIIRRKRVKQVLSIEQRLLNAARDAREAARKLPPGKQRDVLLHAAHEREAAAAMSRWISAPAKS
jgi:hypothetical protein